MKTLIIGIGNPGRGDDGLGPALVERLAGAAPETIPEGAVVAAADGAADAVWKYQLNIEDAALIGDYERVVFADASAAADPGDVSLEPLEPSPAIAFTTHELPPASVLALCQDLYDRTPQAWLLAVGGSSWDLGQGLSDRARTGLLRAETLLRDRLNKAQMGA
jgi:hydrogenase maturation protease